MTINDYLKPERIFFLIKRDFNRQWKDYLITMAAVLGFFLLVEVINAKTGTIDPDIHYGFMSIILFVFGFIFTSMAFREAHRKLLIHDWLMLPASTLEKFISKLLMYTVVYSVAGIIIYTVFSLFSKLIIGVFLGEAYPVFSPASAWVWKLAGHYILVQSVFILGAAWFRNNNFIKTIIALIVFSIIVSTLLSVISWLVFNDYFWTLMRGDFNFNFDLSDGFMYNRLESASCRTAVIGKILYFGIMAPVCWVGAWLKLRELEVSDGV